MERRDELPRRARANQKPQREGYENTQQVDVCFLPVVGERDGEAGEVKAAIQRQVVAVRVVRAVDAQVPLADLSRHVALCLHRFSQRQLAVWQPAAVRRATDSVRLSPGRDHPVADRQPPRHQRGPGWRAEAVARVPLRKPQAFVRHGVDGAALLRRVAVGGQVAPAKVVGEQDHHCSSFGRDIDRRPVSSGMVDARSGLAGRQ